MKSTTNTGSTDDTKAADLAVEAATGTDFLETPTAFTATWGIPVASHEAIAVEATAAHEVRAATMWRTEAGRAGQDVHGIMASTSISVDSLVVFSR